MGCQWTVYLILLIEANHAGYREGGEDAIRVPRDKEKKYSGTSQLLSLMGLGKGDRVGEMTV